MASRFIALRAAAAAVAPWLLSLSVSIEAAAQACSTVGSTTTCDVGDVVDPLYTTPVTQTLLLQGGGSSAATLLLTGPLELRNTAGTYDLVLDSTGFVDSSAVNGAANVIFIRNLDGLITSSWGANAALSATQTAKGIDALSSSGINTVNLLSFGGSIDIANTAMIPDTVGMAMRTDAGGDATALLLASGSVSVTGGDAYGVAAISLQGGDVRTDVRGVVNTLAVNDNGVIAGAYAATTIAGGALVDVSGTVTMDNRPFAATVDSFAAMARVALGNSLSRTVISGTLESWGNFSGGAAAFQEDVGDAEVAVAAGSDITTHGYYSDAVFAVANWGGDVRVTSAGTLLTSGDRANGIYGHSLQGSVTIDSSAGSIQTSGENAHGILVEADRNASVTSGDISTAGDLARGIDAFTTLGVASIDSRGGALQTLGFAANGLRVQAGDGLTLRTGDITTAGERAHAVRAEVTVAGASDIDTTAGQITVAGFQARGIDIRSASGDIAIVAGDIATAGAEGAGIIAEAPDDISIDTTAGTITTQGMRSPGVQITDLGSGSRQLQLGAITANGADSEAARIEARRGAIDVMAGGSLLVTGQGSRALVASSIDDGGASGNIDIDILASVRATGEWGAAVSAESALGAVSLSVGAAGTVLGGWDGTPTSVNPATMWGSAGVILNGGPTQAVTLANAGSIGALSDRAVISMQGTGLQLQNSGSLTGYLALGDGAELFENSGTWSLRHFADGNGDGLRDVEHVARTDFGAGVDVFENQPTGRLLLPAISAAGATDATFAYVPAAMNPAFHAPGGAGIEQGQLLRLERFENRGTISLMDMEGGGAAPVAGDVLLITSGSVDAAGAFTPGSAPAAFVSDGGSLRLDTVLNDGGAGSRSDLLVVDATAVGPGGATRVFVANAGGLGAMTVGNGIKLVDVLNGPAVSAAGAFVLGAPLMAGPFMYNLYRSGPALDDGDWYLSTQLPTPPANPNPPGAPTFPVPPTPPAPPGTTPVPPTPPAPPGPPPTTFRPEAPLLASVPNMMRNYDLAAVGTHHRRVGEEFVEALDGQNRRARSWVRALNASFDTQQEGVLAPASTAKFTGAQVGIELLDGGLIPRGMPSVGLYAGRLTGTSDVNGFAAGIAGTAVGSTDTTDTFVGLYGTHLRKSGVYVEYLLQRSWYAGAIQPVNGASIDLAGNGLLMSLEFGKSVALFSRYRLEPQLQLIAQSQKFDDVAIPNAIVAQRAATMVTARAGLRFSGRFQVAGGTLRPYVRANIWKGAPVEDRTAYSAGGGTAMLDTGIDTTSAEGGVGVSWAFGRNVLAYAEASKLFALQEDASSLESGGMPNASLGLRINW